MIKSANSTVLLADEIASGIRRNIQNGIYPPNSRLTVRRLCEEFGASETPVKQALNQLLSTNLVISIPKCGMRVASFDPQYMKENLEARMMIELYCARPAIEQMQTDPAFAEELRHILEISNLEYTRCAMEYTPEHFNELSIHDRQLHMCIIKRCGNEQIANLYEQLKSHSLMYYGASAHTPETLLDVVEQHTAIVNALINGEAQKLEAAIRCHVQATMDIYARIKV